MCITSCFERSETLAFAELRFQQSILLKIRQDIHDPTLGKDLAVQSCAGECVDGLLRDRAGGVRTALASPRIVNARIIFGDRARTWLHVVCLPRNGCRAATLKNRWRSRDAPGRRRWRIA